MKIIVVLLSESIRRHKAFLNPPCGMSEQITLFVTSLFKGITFDKKMRLDHESLRHPETRILKSHEYNCVKC